MRRLLSRFFPFGKKKKKGRGRAVLFVKGKERTVWLGGDRPSGAGTLPFKKGGERDFLL